MRRNAVCLLAALLLIAACAGPAEPPRSAEIVDDVLESRQGLATYMARALHGKVTASGVPFDMNALLAAHPTYPFGTHVRVTNLKNQRTVDVRIVDRGPASAPKAEGVIIDLSRAAAEALGFVEDGRTEVRVDVLRWGQRGGDDNLKQ
jgi:rare lipoprotein A